MAFGHIVYSIHSIIYILLVVVASWEGFETAYSFSRYHKFITFSENVLGTRLRIKSYKMHFIRVMILFGLLILGVGVRNGS